MHLHMVRVAARPKAQAVRPAKVVSLEVRRKARLEAAKLAGATDHRKLRFHCVVALTTLDRCRQ